MCSFLFSLIAFWFFFHVSYNWYSFSSLCKHSLRNMISFTTLSSVVFLNAASASAVLWMYLSVLSELVSLSSSLSSSLELPSSSSLELPLLSLEVSSSSLELPSSSPSSAFVGNSAARRFLSSSTVPLSLAAFKRKISCTSALFRPPCFWLFPATALMRRA